MILGIGTDLLDCRRLKRPLTTHKDRFLSKILTPNERAYLEKKVSPFEAFLSHSDIEQHFYTAVGKIFAAKEAFVKALGTGFRGHLGLLDMEIVRDDFGKPFIHRYEKTDKVLQGIVPIGMEPHIHLSLSDEYPYVQAFVIVSAY